MFYFFNQSFKVDDLKLIMRHLTHWGHRLFPKMPVDEVFDRCEKLGKKREVQVHVLCMSFFTAICCHLKTLSYSK